MEPSERLREQLLARVPPPSRVLSARSQLLPLELGALLGAASKSKRFAATSSPFRRRYCARQASSTRTVPSASLRNVGSGSSIEPCTWIDAAR